TSLNGIAGTWSPAINNTATTTYTFTPNAGQCATSTTLTITVDDNITPTFDAVGPFCNGATIADLPLTSLNGIAGTWSPAINNTATTTYTFTPNAGQCATSTTLTITVDPHVTPTFNAIGPLCQNTTAPELPAASIEGITGTWSPAAINTATPGTVTYTFTPDAGQCATTTTMDVFVASSAFVITKTATEANYSTVGDVIHYTLILANTGNVAISPVNISDPGADATPGVVRGADQTGDNDNILETGEIWIYTAQHTITQSDINAGGFTNNVTATGSSTPCDPEITTSTVTVPADQRPSLTIAKTSTTDPNTYDAAGDVLTYNLTVTNDGNVTLTNIIVSDPIAVVTGSPIATLAPGASVTLTASYTATQNDLNAGSVYNTATASTTFGTVTVTATDDETIIATQLPALEITKSADRATYIAAGEIINYTLIVSNTGNVTITGITVSDPNAVVTCSGAPYTLAPGASATCTATHTVTPADIIAGNVTNSATVTGTAPNTSPITAISNTVIVLLENLPPTISCPAPIVTSTSNTSCDIIINSGLTATYSDPNNNISRVTWVMTGATSAASPITGINDLSSYAFNLGVTTVTYTVTDAPGLSDNCSFTVTVEDNIAPTAVCEDIDVYLDLATGRATITAADIDGGSFDNCSSITLSASRTDFNCRDLGANTVTLTVTDAAGNRSTCDATVTVHYAADPNPTVTPDNTVICNGETINLALTSQITSTTWTWHVNSPAGITGAQDDNTGTLSTISQTIFNSHSGARQLIYNITPRVYGACNLEPINARVWVNPIPAMEASSSDEILCYGDATEINIRNLNPQVQGQWVYDLRVTAEPGVTGFTTDRRFTQPTYLTEILYNTATTDRKVVYSFTPRIVLPNGNQECEGETVTVTLTVHPLITYNTVLSNYNGYEISCFGYNNGSITLTPTIDLAPFSYSWRGPNGYSATNNTGYVSDLYAGDYIITIT
ncbi:MAG: PKD-like domain-containing protein, partial [Bacteroidales bacterium]|nr:PKD-like domain-containing protein [Bacteroidales bacterium]